MKRYFLILVIALAYINTTIGQTKNRPNVILIMCDDLNDYEGIFGGHPQAKTPNIDRLAKSGVQFINAQSNIPVCSPSRNSLFTGVYPFVSEDYGWDAHYTLDVLKHNKTFIELLGENGYHTMGTGKLLHSEMKESWTEWEPSENHYGPYAYNGTKTVAHPNVPKPFQEIGAIDGSFSPLEAMPEFPKDEIGENPTGWKYDSKGEYYRPGIDLTPDEMHAKWAAKRIKEMDNKALGQPFFMGVGFVRPHTPLHAPKRFFDMFPIDGLELSPIKEGDNADTYYKDLYDKDKKGPRYFRTLRESYGGDTEMGLKHFLQAYLACVAFLDEQVGVVLDALENSTFKDNTIVILTADHGWQMGEKEYLFKNSPWEESARIPLVIKSPDCKKGAKVGQPVSLIDLYPTLVDLCQLKGDYKKSAEGGNLGGHSMVPFLKDPNTKEWTGPSGALTMVGVDRMYSEDKLKHTYSYRTKDWRYIRYYDGREELYDHKKDPYEWDNLAQEKGFEEIKQKMKNEMIAIIRETAQL